VFPVEIDREKSVGALKDAIKDKKRNRLHDIDADSLDLWRVSKQIAHSLPLINSQVSIPPEDHDDVLPKIQDPQSIVGARKLHPTDLLSEIFGTDCHAKHLHVVVKAFDTGEFILCANELGFTIGSPCGWTLPKIRQRYVNRP